jgi:hypothetical protein
MANSKEQKTRRIRAWQTVRNRRQEVSGHGEQEGTEENKDQETRRIRRIRQREQEGTEDEMDQGMENILEQKTRIIGAWNIVKNRNH